MPTDHPLLIDLTGVARLADVQRPVASMWRNRFAATPDPFPSPVDEIDGRPHFDAERVAEWLANTGHGNNPEARADAAAAAAPSDFSFRSAKAVAELEALIALSPRLGSLTGSSPQTISDAAAEADPHDELLRSEVTSHLERGAPWLDYAARLIDAAYSPPEALTLVGRRFSASQGSKGSAGPLRSEVVSLVVEAIHALVADSDATVTLDPHDVELSSALASSLSEQATLTLPADTDARRLRRRLLTNELWVATGSEPGTRSIVTLRVPANRGDDVAAMLRAADEASLAMSPLDAGVVIGPARALVDPLGPADEQSRADILRSGRVRGIARLGPGLVESAVREPLALWILGTPATDVVMENRLTAVADLADVTLTPAARADLVSDIVASTGTGRDVAAHSYRFATLVRTSSLQARSDSLVAAATRKQSPSPIDAADLPAVLDAAAEAVRNDMLPIPVAPASGDVPRAAPVSELIDKGHLKLIRGTRIDPDSLGSSGLIVVTSADLDHPSAIGTHRLDQFTFTAQHPSAHLTQPGDVIFRTSPTAAAWVDADGSKVVAYPARVLRITPDDPGGLVPEIVAADITGAASGPGAWKRWLLRRVAPHATGAVRQALASIAATRADLQTRVARLDDYAALIVAGATTGAVTVTDTTGASPLVSPSPRSTPRSRR